jgi:O-acetyl-ADP-ribose deacetylase (regulator of RNase III)
LEVDAIVDASNRQLADAGGVDAAIRKAAGPKLAEACENLGGCAFGEAKITPGFRLPAQHVIHTVGPVWWGGMRREAELLAHCYTSCLNLARQEKLKTIAFPAISTGVYHYPLHAATEIAVCTVKNWLEENPKPALDVTFVAYSVETYNAYRIVMKSVGLPDPGEPATQMA